MESLENIIHYSSIVTGEIICIAVISIIIIGMLFERKKRKSTLYFLISCIVVLISISADIIYWRYMAGTDYPTIVLAIATVISYLASVMLIPISLYQREYVKERTSVNPWLFRILIMLSSFYFLIMLITIFTGNIFVIENGDFVKVGGIPTIAKVIAGIAYLYTFGILFANIKKIGVRACLLLCSFGFVPIIFILFFYDYTPVGTALNMILVYVLLQNNNSLEKERNRKKLENLNEELQIHQEELEDNLIHDLGSGCKNRNALNWVYEGSFDKTQSFTVIMCDLNGLKKENDINGHDAGDRFIKECAQSLIEVFGKENVYRIGGDEFIIVLVGLLEEEVLSLIEKCNHILKDKVSIGYIYNNSYENNFNELVKKADENMYVQKALYYSSHEKYR